MTLYYPKNRVGDELAADFEHGTDTSLTLSDASDFPTDGNYILIEDSSDWALYEYTGISTNDLTGLTSADALNESSASHTFRSGSPVDLVQSSDVLSDILDILKGTAGWPEAQDAGGKALKNLLAIIDSARSTAPSNPSEGDIYSDDGTNTDSEYPGLKIYRNGQWVELATLSHVFSGSHSDLSDVSSSDHHTKYSDLDAQEAIDDTTPSLTSVKLSNKEWEDIDTDGELYWDKSAGMYIKSSNASGTAAGGRLQWSGANVSTGRQIEISYGSEDEPTIATEYDISVVDSLPSSPSSDTLYFVKE